MNWFVSLTLKNKFYGPGVTKKCYIFGCFSKYGSLNDPLLYCFEYESPSKYFMRFKFCFKSDIMFTSFNTLSSL